MASLYGGLNAGSIWRVWVTRCPIRAALLAGLIAQATATTCGIWFYGIGLPSIDWPTLNGGPINPNGSVIEKFLVGGTLLTVNCGILALIFAFFVFPNTWRTVSPVTNLLKALTWSMVLATIAAAFVFPYVYYKGYDFGYGGIHHGGWKYVFAIYLWLAIWGVSLGLAYSPLELDDVRLKHQLGSEGEGRFPASWV